MHLAGRYYFFIALAKLTANSSACDSTVKLCSLKKSKCRVSRTNRRTKVDVKYFSYVKSPFHDENNYSDIDICFLLTSRLFRSVIMILQ